MEFASARCAGLHVRPVGAGDGLDARDALVWSAAVMMAPSPSATATTVIMMVIMMWRRRRRCHRRAGDGVIMITTTMWRALTGYDLPETSYDVSWRRTLSAAMGERERYVKNGQVDRSNEGALHQARPLW
jgi:hypothetical protein